MKNINYFKMLSFFLIAPYLLAACGGTLPPVVDSAQDPRVQPNVVVFTGIVNSISGKEWTVSGQKVTLDPQASLDPNIASGDEVKVQAHVLADGAIVALKVESSRPDDIISTPAADANASGTPKPIGTPSPDATSIPAANSTSDASTPSARQSTGVNGNEVFGSVESLTATTITVSGVTYTLTNSTEFKDVLIVGDQVKLHICLNADGTVIVCEIEKTAGLFDDNSNADGSEDGPGHDANNGHTNHNSDDDGHDDHGSDDNGSSSDDD